MGAVRIDSWKAIARYLGKDERTVRRWERDRGLPIRRVPGARGGTVFAYAAEIDDWLASGGGTGSDADRLEISAGNGRRWPLPALGAVVGVVLLGGIAVRLGAKRDTGAPLDLRLRTSADGLVASNARGVEQWRFPFDPDYRTGLPDIDTPEPSLLVGGAQPAVFFATATRVRVSDRRVEGGTLYQLDVAGKLRRTFSFNDTVAIDGKSYAGPWALMSFAVSSGPARRVAVVAHDYTWNPGIVALLDSTFHRQSTMVNNGWLESVRWLGADRLIVSGFSNTRNGGLVALLDGTTPVRMVAMPRSPVNVATGSRFNRAVVQIMGDRVVVHTIEMPTTTDASVEAIYEFTPALDLVSAEYSDGYLALWRKLEAQGRLRPMSASRDTADRDRPTRIDVWDRAKGWRAEPIGKKRP